jgi:hydrogenase nickel incorporation protein HypA/HybF
MHEVSLVSALVEQVEEVSRREGFRRVLEIRLSVGELSGVEPSCVEFCFSEVTRGTILEGARLRQESVRVELECQTCGARTSPGDPSALHCGSCHSGVVKVLRGRDFRIVDLDVE